MFPKRVAAIRCTISKSSWENCASFSEDLAKKPMLRGRDEIDAAQDPERMASLERLAAERGLPFFKISSVTGEGIDALKRAMAEAVFVPQPAADDGAPKPTP